MCRDVLVYAAHNLYQNLSTHSMQSDLRDAMCASQGSSSGGSSSWGGGIEVFGYGGLNADSAKSQYSAVQSNLCKSSGSKLSNSDYDFVLKNIVDHDSVDAWRDCTSQGGKGLRGKIELNDTDLILSVWWNAGFDVATTTATSSSISGVEGCTMPWPASGTVIGSAEQTMVCKRKGDEAVTYALNSSKGSLVLKLPRKLAPPVMSAFEKCLGGDKDACATAALEQNKLCVAENAACKAGAQVCGTKLRDCQAKLTCVGDFPAALDAQETSCASASAAACTEAHNRVESERRMCRIGAAMMPAPPPQNH
ncbi:MAG TPA: hypothetical protein VG889_11310 [Rhizomicrobium sp.]|nr:hypothetical protein [Rhizomicrobium sp.]